MWLRRWLKTRGYEVTLVHNVTDVDDHIYEEAAKLGKGSRELAEEATAWFIQDTDDLGLGRPDVEPRASETIPEIIAFIEALISEGKAYESEGSVYFRVASYPDYGQLSGARLEDMVAQEPNPTKEDERDFALWKAQKSHEDAAWESPWGSGRPGWHIECSAMAEKHLGPDFEIHGGGLDLRFPHHENELAQSRSRGYPFARVWIHNGMLELGEEKMSKSLGNVVTLRNVLDVWGREVLLLYHLSGHWRKPVDFTDESLESARTQVESFRNVFRDPPPRGSATPGWDDFVAALEDDFNTPEALSIMHSWRRQGSVDWLEDALGIFGLESLVTELGLAREVRFTGYRDADLPGVLQALDAFALMGAGSDESCRAALEAMAAGRPVVARRVGALPETVLHGVTGLLVDDDRPESVAAALGALIADPERAVAMGRAGRERARALYGSDAHAARVEAVYESALRLRSVGDRRS